MRFTRQLPKTADELKRYVLADPESLAPGFKTIAQEIPLPDRGSIDLLAADGRGRLAVVSFCLEADHAAIGRAVSQWDWVVSNLGALRTLIPAAGLDLTLEPRAFVAAGHATEGARRLAAAVTRPHVEILETWIVSFGDRKGVLVERAAPATPPRAATGLDPVLAGVPAGESRSLIRRILEELRDVRVEGQILQPVGIDADVDLLVGGRVVASIVAAPSGVEVRRYEGASTHRVANDADCREAVEFLLAASRERGIPDARTADRGRSEAGSPAAALTSEEIAEFERIARGEPARPDRGRQEREADRRVPRHEGPPVGVARPRFVEN